MLWAKCSFVILYYLVNRRALPLLREAWIFRRILYSVIPRSCRSQWPRGLKAPIYVRVWLASPAGLGFQWVKLVCVWSVTSRTLADFIYILYISISISIRAWLPSQAPRGGLASQTRTCMGTFRRRSTTSRLLRSWARIPRGAWMFVLCIVK
jgi:hypothetical protein